MVGPLTNGPLRMYKAQSMADSTAKIEFILVHHGTESRHDGRSYGPNCLKGPPSQQALS